MPAAKSLRRHVSDRTFRSRRHRELLSGAPLPWPALAAIQQAYQATTHDLERRAIGVDFERAVREFDERLDTLLSQARLEDLDEEASGEPQERPRTRAELAAELQAIIDGPPEPYNRRKNREATNRFGRALFARDLRRTGLSLKAIGERLGVAPATVRRYLRELEGRGF